MKLLIANIKYGFTKWFAKWFGLHITSELSVNYIKVFTHGSLCKMWHSGFRFVAD